MKSFPIIGDLLSFFLSMYVLFLNIKYGINEFLGSCLIRISFGIVIMVLGRTVMLRS
ncbi:hypothetical protein Scep_014431 [Stephania cephalantha]|uniref:Uncharacterized protein n=1 Tax=Stephania cephalantha TaxID=152367 RepID=A0AAP0J201_9MAGN